MQREEEKDDKLININSNDSSINATPTSQTPKEKEALTILVVEDNVDMRGYIRSILREQYNVLEAADGEEALHILNSNPVDFIISDLMMPVMDGVELSRRVKDTFRHFTHSFPDANCQDFTRGPFGKLSYGSR